MVIQNGFPCYCNRGNLSTLKMLFSVPEQMQSKNVFHIMICRVRHHFCHVI